MRCFMNYASGASPRCPLIGENNIRFANDWDGARLFKIYMYIYDESYFYTKILKCSESEAQDLTLLTESCYHRFSIPKKDGSRELCAVIKDSPLYKVQVNLKKYFSKLPVPEVAKGFAKGQSYFDFLIPHLNKRYYLRLDIKDFFGSITRAHVLTGLKGFCSLDQCVELVGDLCTLDGTLPQGAVTSPALSNLVFARVDQRILKYCQSLITVYAGKELYLNDVVYTRYADDLLFSSNCLDFRKSKYFLRTVKKILSDNGFQIHASKTKYGYDQIVLSGYVVGSDIHLSRKKMSELNRILYYFDAREQTDHSEYKVAVDKLKNEKELIKNIIQLSDESQHGDAVKFTRVIDLVNYLCGYRAFLISVDKANFNKNSKILQNRKRIKKIEAVVDALAAQYTL